MTLTSSEETSAAAYREAHANDPEALKVIRRVLNLSPDVVGCPGTLADEVYAALVEARTLRAGYCPLCNPGTPDEIHAREEASARLEANVLEDG